MTMQRSHAFRPVRSWLSVHQIGPALFLLAVAGAGSLLLATSTVEDVGVVRLAVPVSALLLLPALAGVAAAIGTVRQASLPLPDPPRAIAARLISALVLITVAVLVSLSGLLVADDRTAGPIIRNVLLHAGLALVMARIDTRLQWLPSLVLTLMAMMFGYSEPGGRIARWAFVLDGTLSTWQVAVAVALVVIGVVAVLIPPRNRLR
jgi:hypothetical protein